MLSAIILVIETYSDVIGLIMLHLPRLTAFVVLICTVAPAVVILLTPVLLVIELASKGRQRIKRVNAGLWITALILSLLLWIINFGLWWFGGIGLTRIPLLMRTLFHRSTTQFPLGELSGIEVDSKGNVYLASPDYERIQVYTNQGKFSRGCFVESGGGLFDIWIEDNQLHAVISRGWRHHVFDLNGKLLKRIEIASQEEHKRLFEKAGGLKTQDALGNTYTIQNEERFPKVVKISPDGEQSLLIKNPLYLRLLQKPQPVFGFGIAGLIMTIILAGIIKIKVDFRQFNSRPGTPRQSPKVGEGIPTNQLDNLNTPFVKLGLLTPRAPKSAKHEAKNFLILCYGFYLLVFSFIATFTTSTISATSWT